MSDTGNPKPGRDDEYGRWRGEDVLLPADDATAEQFPTMRNISTAFLFKAIVRAVEPTPPEYVTLPELARPTMELAGAVGKWNMLWEAAHYRRRFFDLDDLPAVMAEIADLGDINVVFLPRTSMRYHEYAPLVHLLPRRTLQKFEIPLLRGGQWPFMADYAGTANFLPDDFQHRLQRAWASTVWPHLDSGSPLGAFCTDEPLQLLAHNLDFWVPAVTAMIQDRLSDHAEIDKGPLPDAVSLQDGSALEGAVPAHPRAGGQIWFGEDDARQAVAETVEAADNTGQLRAIIDAIRSNRVVDDFSNRWSYAREDFERKLYRKRSKVGVRFVELTDMIPVQAPESEIVGNLVTNDFLTVLDARNRQIVVLLNSGVTSRTEIAERLGYANHSAVSKRLVQIRTAAAAFFDAQ